MIKIIISLIITFCLFIVSHLFDNEYFSIKNNNFMEYRLGDFLKGYLYLKEKYHLKRMLTLYPNSLCSKYYKIIKDYPEDEKWNNIKVISNLVDEINTDIPKK
jgi:hypothetical protein